MNRKFHLLSMTLLLLAAACLPVGQIDIGVEPTQIIVTPLPEATEEAAEPETGPVETEEPAESPAASGAVEGGVCYPSEGIPAMTAYFRNIDDGALFELPIAENQTSYSLELPAGTYIAFAYVDNPDIGLGGQYSAAVPCGLSVDCVDHSPLPFDIVAGQTTGEIDLCDWYEPLAVPADPEASLQVDPQLAGLLFEYGGAYYLAGDGGTAEQVFAPFQAFEVVFSPDGSQAVFNREDDLYLADLTNGAWRNLTNTPERWESNPIWVPGGSLLAFLSSENLEDRMAGQISLIGLDGSGYTVADERPTGVLPAFDPSGTLMAFSLGDTAWMYHIANATVEQFDPAVYGLANVRSIASPSFSPDGRKLAWWVVVGEPGASTTSLAVFDLGEGLGSGSVSLKHSYEPIGGGGYNNNPSWSPDGEWLATIVLSDGAKAGLYIISANTDEVINLGGAASPVWSENSGALVYRLWPQDGGPAWESTLMLFSLTDRQIVQLELPNGANPIGFFE